MPKTYRDAKARVDAEPELAVYRQALLPDWLKEDDKFWEFVCHFPVQTLVEWAQSVGDEVLSEEWKLAWEKTTNAAKELEAAMGPQWAACHAASRRLAKFGVPESFIGKLDNVVKGLFVSIVFTTWRIMGEMEKTSSAQWTRGIGITYTPYTHHDAKTRVDAEPELAAYRQALLPDWLKEDDKFWEFVCTAPVQPLVEWAEAAEEGLPEEWFLMVHAVQELEAIIGQAWAMYRALARGPAKLGAPERVIEWLDKTVWDLFVETVFSAHDMLETGSA